MSVTEQTGSGSADRVRTTVHESFLAIGNFRYLKLATLTGILSLALYVGYRPLGGRYGGSLAGYILGTVGALLILWLTWFGYKKRSFSAGRNRLAARLSAHVYLGLVLLVVATLHTGFYFGWNVHTLAYVLMCIVIFSGIFGVFCYAHYPRMMTENRGNMTMQQMLGRVATLNDELRAGALPLDDATTAIVQRAIDSTEIGGSTWRQISGKYPRCATAAAIRQMDATLDQSPTAMSDARRRVHVLLDEKAAILTRIRRDISYKAMMDIWLYFHVPITFALLAALFAHIISVFFLW